MSQIKVNRIKSYLDKTFTGKINLTDIDRKPIDEKAKNFLSRALASYSLVTIGGASIDESADAVTDGFDDNGIDAIYFDRSSRNLWLVQSKFIATGSGGIDNGDIEKFTKGVKKLIDGDFSRFNFKISDRQEEILEALEDASVKVQILFVYTGPNLSRHNLLSVDDLLKEQNETDEILIFHDFNLDKIYKSLVTGVGSSPINEDVMLANWGHIEEPLKSFYGQISGSDLGMLWQKYGRKLFTENIRSFLGGSNVNEEILKTIKAEPENFIYFNNGITILCDSIKKKILGGTDRTMGTFTCNGIAVVNGAQTLGSLGSLAESNPDELGRVKVFVKFISLEGSPEGFGHRITIATNTQNKVDKKDFISLDSEQARLKIELKLEGIDYHIKRSDEKVLADDHNYLLEEVAFSLASLSDNVDYSTMIKKESGKLWDDVTRAPYTDIFNADLTAHKIIKSVKVYRFISSKMKGLAGTSNGRERSIYMYGNSFVAHMAFSKMPKNLMADNNTSFDTYFNLQLESLVNDIIAQLKKVIENHFSDAMIVYVLRNYTKCRQLKTFII